MIGTLVNAVSVLLGGGIGLLCKGKLSSKITDNLTKAIGLCVCVIGISGAIQGDVMLLVVSLALGTLVGEILDIDAALNRLGTWVQNRLTKDKKSNIAQGFVAATLLFCIGAMSIVGSIESGLKNEHSILFTKSVIDGVSAMVLASTLGVGVLFSSATVLVYQGSITLFSGYLQNVLVNDLIVQISATGSVMILGIGLNMVLNANIKVANLLPGLLVAIAYYYIVF